MTYSHTVIIIKGAILRNALCNIFRGADGFILTDDENVEVRAQGLESLEEPMIDINFRI